MLHPVTFSDGPAGAGGPSPCSLMTVVTSPIDLTPPPAVIAALRALGVNKIRPDETGSTFVGKTSKTALVLGEGGFSVVHLGFKSTPEGVVTPAAVAKSKKKINLTFLELLQSIPQSPFILARPTHVPGDKHTRLCMDLLPAGGDLITQIAAHPQDDEWAQWTTFIAGMVSVTQALAVFHAAGMVHRDCTLENSCTTGLFDHGTLCKAGEFSPVMGAALASTPPEILKAIKYLLESQGEDTSLVVSLLSASDPTDSQDPAEYNLDDGTIAYTTASDVYVVGYQFQRVLKSLQHPEVFLNHDLSFFAEMLHPNPLHRPGIHTFIYPLKHYLAQLMGGAP